MTEITIHPRRHFLYQSAALLATALAGPSFNFKKYKPKLSFSTLGCPDWSFEKIIHFAKENGYHGVEIRTVQRNLDIPKVAEFSSPEKIGATRRFVKDNGVKIVNLGASTALHYSDIAKRKSNLDEGKRFIDLAQQLDCPFIRVFPNDFPPDQEKNTTIDFITKGLLELGEYAKGTGVTVLMESHGQVVRSNDLETIMKAAEHSHVGMVWDIVNMWSVTKERPVDVYEKLKKYIRHAHIKDANIVDGKEQYTLLGEGETPIFEGIDALAKGHFSGYFSFEWEKLWHPEIAEPEIAIGDYPKAMKAHFDKIG